MEAHDQPDASRTEDTSTFDVDAHVRATTDAVWDSGSAATPVIGGVLSGDIGHKGVVSARLRALSLEQRRAHGMVSRGSSIRGGGLLIALTAGTIILLASAALLLIVWVVT